MRYKSLLIALIALILSSSCEDNSKRNRQFASFRQLQKHFEDVPNDYKTVPFWVWNGDITKAFIDEQLRDFSDKGFGGVFVHPRYGLITEYASEEWYGLVEYALKRAKKLGMDLWLYDENSFPSGFGGGRVPASMPESYDQGHALRMHRQNMLLPDSSLEYELVFMKSDSLVDITSQIDSFAGRQGDFLLFEKVYFPRSDWYAGFSYVDLLKPGVTEQFIASTMPGYEEHLGSEFGNHVPGIFTDEPNIAPQKGPGLIRWTPDLFERFAERWGYRLEPNLVSLLEDVGMYHKVRHNYYQLLLELFIERWSKPWYEYCQENDLLWTGHYWEHGWPSPLHGPDNMAMYAWHQVPGIDMLFNNGEERPDQFGNIRAVKELNSVGNQFGRLRKLSETYGGSGWSLTFEDMKRNGDWEYVMGVNMMNQHLSYGTIMGDRKHDFPQSFSYHAPYWDLYPVLNSYFARLSFALSCGVQKNKTLILEPTTTAWMHYSSLEKYSDLKAINAEFNKLLLLLEEEHIEYDLGSENIIRDHGRVENGEFFVGESSYNFVVLPVFMESINSETAALIGQYLEEGGYVLALCEPPVRVDGVPSDLGHQWVSEYNNQWLSLVSCNDPRLIHYLRTEDFVITEQEGATIFHYRRRLDDGQLVFFANSSKNETGSIRLVTQGKDIIKMDLFSGEMSNYPCVVTSDIISYDVSLDPAQSILLFIADEEEMPAGRAMVKWKGKESAVKLENLKATLIGDNALTLDYCFLDIDGKSTDLLYFYDAQTRIFKHFGFDKNPWVSASQFKTEILDRDTFPSGSGFEARYPFFVDSDFKSNDLRVVLEKPYLYVLSLNGVPLQRERDSWWLDKEFGVYRIRDGIIPGLNELSVKADPMSVHCELEPLYLVGNLDVYSLDKGWMIASPRERSLGSWKSQGLPFYSGRMDYNATVDLERNMPVKVRLTKWNGTVAQVRVNNKPAGLIFSSPYELRIDEFIRKGNNKITLEVYGSLKNLLGPHHNVQRHGIVTPWSFKYAPAEQPSGIDYDLIDYGLMEPFEVIVQNDP